MTASRKGAEASSILPSSSTTTTPPVLGVRSAGRATRSKAARSTPYLPTRGGPGRSTWARTSRAPDTASTRKPSRRPPARSSAVVNPPDRHARLLQQVQQAPGHGGLADPWATLEQQPRGILIHEVNLADRHRGPRGDRTSRGWWDGADRPLRVRADPRRRRRGDQRPGHPARPGGAELVAPGRPRARSRRPGRGGGRPTYRPRSRDTS